MNRRQFMGHSVRIITQAAAVSALTPWWLRHRAFAKPTDYQPNPQLLSQSGQIPNLQSSQLDLTIGYQNKNYTGKDVVIPVINQSLPAPVIHWKEGEIVTVRVHNRLAEDTSIHWHGIILPSDMDGVPGLSFAGIRPGQTFTYQFRLQQSGTYWYHSHSGMQEQQGLYGALVIHPQQPDPYRVDRDYTIVLSEWTDDSPHSIYRKLKQQGHFYATRERTLLDLIRDIQDKGLTQTAADRAMWNEMRMSEYDLADVTARTYTYLVNGCAPQSYWYGQFRAGETIRLRLINASAMTFFDVRIPGLRLKVIAADGQLIDPVDVEEIRLGVAETYDVLVTPTTSEAFAIFAQSLDRGGFALGVLTPDPRWVPIIPSLDPVQPLTHADMGMSHGAHGGHAAHSDHMTASQSMPMSHSGDHSHHIDSVQFLNHTNSENLGKAGMGSIAPVVHLPSERHFGVDMQATAPLVRLNDPGVGLRNNGRRVLTYADLCNYYPTPDPREPTREIALHLTGNMARYMWSFDGIPFSKAEPIILKFGERVRFTLVNDTMMNHPIHLHGMWSDLETMDPRYIPRKHTVIVQPGSKISYLVTADQRGRWAYHCHLLYHMMGMFREVRV